VEKNKMSHWKVEKVSRQELADLIESDSVIMSTTIESLEIFYIKEDDNNYLFILSPFGEAIKIFQSKPD
jgi:hypothetical protein